MNKIIHRYFILHKPFGFVSQFIHNEKKRKNKSLLGELHPFPDGTMAIGRLDKNSEGLLLLTTDGVVSARVRSKAVEKEYYVQVDGVINEEALDQMRKGLELLINGEKHMSLPCKAFRLEEEPQFENRKVRDERHGPTSWISVTLSEGKFRQVRKMTAAVGFPSLRLVRVRVGDIHLGTISPGEVIEVPNFDTEHKELKNG